jgi:hypothetical protein
MKNLASNVDLPVSVGRMLNDRIKVLNEAKLLY